MLPCCMLYYMLELDSIEPYYRRPPLRTQYTCMYEWNSLLLKRTTTLQFHHCYHIGGSICLGVLYLLLGWEEMKSLQKQHIISLKQWRFELLTLLDVQIGMTTPETCFGDSIYTPGSCAFSCGYSVKTQFIKYNVSMAGKVCLLYRALDVYTASSL